MPVRLIQGDLFDARDCSLAHCISLDLRMTRGISVTFDKIFQGRRQLMHHARNKDVGEILYLRRHGHFVYYLITKKKCGGKPDIYTIRCALKSMAKHA